MEKVNFLSAWSLPQRLFIFGAVVITMMKGSVTVAALPWLAQLGGGRDGRTDTELLSQPGMAGMGVLSASGSTGVTQEEVPNPLLAWSWLASDPRSFPGMVPRSHHYGQEGVWGSWHLPGV